MDARVGQRRIWWERLIWALDMTAYAFVGLSGFGATFDPSGYVQRTLDGYGWVLLLWGMLLIVGGIGGAVGRLVRIWAIEYTANVFAGWGVFLYLVILLPTIADGGSLALAGVVYVAWAFVLRRYSELNIFTNDPRDPGLRAWLEAIVRRRTQNVVPRDRL